MHVISFQSQRKNTFIMRIQLDKTKKSIDFPIVLPHDTVESIYHEFRQEFPMENGLQFKQVLDSYFPRRIGRFTAYYEK